MKTQAKLIPIVGIIGLSLTFLCFLFPFVWELYEVVLDEYRRNMVMYSSETPTAPPPAPHWRNPTFWQTALHILWGSKFILTFYTAVFAFTAYLFTLMLHWLQGRPRLHRLGPQIFYVFLGAILSLLFIYIGLGPAPRMFNPSLFQLLSFIVAVNYLFVTLLLPRARRIMNPSTQPS